MANVHTAGRRNNETEKSHARKVPDLSPTYKRHNPAVPGTVLDLHIGDTMRGHTRSRRNAPSLGPEGETYGILEKRGGTMTQEQIEKLKEIVARPCDNPSGVHLNDLLSSLQTELKITKEEANEILMDALDNDELEDNITRFKIKKV